MKKTKSKSRTVMKSALTIVGEVESARSMAHRDIATMSPKALAEYHLTAAKELVGKLETEFMILDGEDTFSAEESLKIAHLAERIAARVLTIRNIGREVAS